MYIPLRFKLKVCIQLINPNQINWLLYHCNLTLFTNTSLARCSIKYSVIWPCCQETVCIMNTKCAIHEIISLSLGYPAIYTNNVVCFKLFIVIGCQTDINGIYSIGDKVFGVVFKYIFGHKYSTELNAHDEYHSHKLETSHFPMCGILIIYCMRL